MDVAQASSAPWPLKIGEYDLEMHALADIDIGALDNWVRARHVAALIPTLDGLDPDQQNATRETILLQAARMIAFSPEGSKLLGTPIGVAALVHYSCTPRVPIEKLEPLMHVPSNINLVRAGFRQLNPWGNPASRAKGPAESRKKSTKETSTRRSRSIQAGRSKK